MLRGRPVPRPLRPRGLPTVGRAAVPRRECGAALACCTPSPAHGWGLTVQGERSLARHMRPRPHGAPRTTRVARASESCLPVGAGRQPHATAPALARVPEPPPTSGRASGPHRTRHPVAPHAPRAAIGRRDGARSHSARPPRGERQVTPLRDRPPARGAVRYPRRRLGRHGVPGGRAWWCRHRTIRSPGSFARAARSHTPARASPPRLAAPARAGRPRRRGWRAALPPGRPPAPHGEVHSTFDQGASRSMRPGAAETTFSTSVASGVRRAARASTASRTNAGIPLPSVANTSVT